MPSVRFRAGRPTFYLDTSTLSYAFRAGGRGDPPAFAGLRTRVEAIARTDNLCLSTMHVAELAQGEESLARSMLDWLDSLDSVWMYNFQKVREREDEQALQRAVGIVDAPAVVLFAPSLLSLFDHWGLDAVSEALRGSSPLRNLAAAARVKGLESERAMMRRMSAACYYDRKVDPSTLQMTDAEKEASVGRKRRALRGKEAAQAYERLRGVDLRAFHELHRASPDPVGAFTELVLASPMSLPSSFILEQFGGSFIEVAAAREPGSNRARELESSFYDYAHLAIGAAYCDVFTCDALSSQCLGDTRVRLGREPQIALGKGALDAAGFVRALGC